MESINTFERHLRLANMSWGFRFQSVTVLVNTSITKSLFIVLNKCLLLVQFCPTHVFSPGTTVRALWKSVLLYRRNEFPNLCLLASLIVTISGSNSSVERMFSFVTNILSNKHLSMSHYTLENSVIVSGKIPFGARKKGRKLSILR